MTTEESAKKVQQLREERRGQKERAPLEHYLAEFAAASPEDMAARSGVPYDGDAGCFRLRVVGRPTTVSWPDLEVRDDATGESASTYTRILLACLLLRGKLVPATGTYLAYTEIPWGSHYFRAFEARCIKRLARTYGEDVEGFAARCRKLGAIERAGADACFDVELVDGVYVRLSLWEGDDEFPANAQITFSDNASLAFAAEELAVAGDVVLGAVDAQGFDDIDAVSSASVKASEHVDATSSASVKA